MQQLSLLIDHLKRLEPFSLSLLSFGLRVACGLYAMCYLFSLTAGRFGDLDATLACLDGALEAAPAVLTVCVFVAFLADLEAKYRRGK